MNDARELFQRCMRFLSAVGRLTRLENQITFAQIVFGYAYATHFRLTWDDWSRIGGALVSIGLLLYSGIYALNDVADAQADALNSLKRTRPIPSGRMRRSTAAVIAISLILAGLAASASSPQPVVLRIALLFLAINAFYTFFAKHIPYLDILTNGSTHALRVLFGMQLAGGAPDWPLVAVWYIGAVNLALFRRVKELWQGDEKARGVLQRYTAKGLQSWYTVTLPAMLILGVMFRGMTLIASLGWIGYTLLAVIGTQRSTRIRRIAEFLWR
ncbi:MAG: hypothetical protein G01um1014106_604 [Parcubacteria group bacterium Gr01-1014_106]|nr:MAG: hypothetical protein G01um1014106_604 [Parcubacteria group bacterium Gr01-1014_106]